MMHGQKSIKINNNIHQILGEVVNVKVKQQCLGQHQTATACTCNHRNLKQTLHYTVHLLTDTVGSSANNAYCQMMAYYYYYYYLFIHFRHTGNIGYVNHIYNLYITSLIIYGLPPKTV